MMRSFFILAATVAILFVSDAAAQSCAECLWEPDPEPPMVWDENCNWTATGEFGSCYEEITAFDSEGNPTKDKCVTTTASYCPREDGGGGDGDGGLDPLNPGGGDDGGSCDPGGWGGCPAQCHSCL